MKLKVGLLQYSISLNPDYNWGRIEEMLLQDYSAEDLVILPELSLRPYPREEGDYFYNTLDDNYIKKFKTLAKHLNTHIMAGFYLEKPDGRSNELLLFSNKGEIVLSYSKQKLFKFWQEERFVQAGSCNQKTCINEFEIVPFICYDLRFPELFRKACGVELFVIQANWPEERIHHWHSLLQARAIENQAFVVGVNRAGSSSEHYFPGASQVVSPSGEVLGQLGEDEGYLSQDLDLDKLREYRRRFPIL